MTPKIPLSRPYFNQDELSELASTLQTGWVSRGPKCQELEGAVAEYLGRRHAVTVSNCTAALHLALRCLDIGPGDEVIVPDFTFPATALAVLHAGARPVFVDVDIRDYCIDPREARKAITERTKAIMPVHLFGQPAEMDEIDLLAREYGLMIIEDAACALGASRNGRKMGTWGDVACFSLHGRKVITTGEGGILVTDDDEVAARARSLSQFGISAPYERTEGPGEIARPSWTELAWNYKLSDIQAAVGVAQMRKLEQILEMRRELARGWDQFCSQEPEIEMPACYVTDRHAWQAYVCRIDDDQLMRTIVMDLRGAGFEVTFGTYACLEQPIFEHLARAECPVSRHLFYHTLALPMPAGLNLNFRKDEDGSIQGDKQ